MQVELLLEGRNMLALTFPDILRVIEIAFHPGGGLICSNYSALCEILPGVILCLPHSHALTSADVAEASDVCAKLTDCGIAISLKVASMLNGFLNCNSRPHLSTNLCDTTPQVIHLHLSCRLHLP